MNLPVPFAYPLEPHLRRHGPAGYRNYQDYKPWLRDDFTFRCVYCLARERWYPDGAASFSVDHVEPQSAAPSRVGDYDNLVYACTRCNTARQDARVLDPTEAAFGEHLQLAEDGSIRAFTPDGQDLVDLLHLDSPAMVRVRRKVLRVLTLQARYPDDPEVRQEFLDVFGYPDDLPDLVSLRPPSGNHRDENLLTCYHARRQKHDLPAVY